MAAVNAYEGVEAPANFKDGEALARYRATVLEKSKEQASFIRRHFQNASSLIEACCGNARLLIALADSFDRLEGFDLAASRIAFAQRWIADLALPHVGAHVGDMFAYKAQAADVGICITGALGYFDGLGSDGGKRALQAFSSLIRPGGGLLLELYQHPRVRSHCALEADGVIRHWQELPPEDPFRFYLSRYRFDQISKLLHHEKTFVGRDGSVDEGRSETLRVYSAEEMIGLLDPGYEDIVLFSGWRDEPYKDGDDTMVVTARRRLGAL